MSRCQPSLMGKLYLYLPLLLLLLNSSCTVWQLPAFLSPGRHTQAHAEQLFINGDFQNALLEYEQIYESALLPGDENQALYGLACTQMMLAQNTTQFIEAIGNLQKWDANKGSALFTENRHLLILALQQQSSRMEQREKALTDRENQKNALIANQQLKISQLTTNAEQMQSRIDQLQNQITELEAIDKNVQENRKPL